ncbi:MAG: phosphatase PAP2 family protein [Pseudomonadota bacterium]|nr:phosphatase PAP2 family protein [Pseudomonadota bacterium]
MAPPEIPTFLHWPGAAKLGDRGGPAVFFLGFFYLFFGGAAWLSDFVPWRFNVGFEWEKAVPFLPWSALVYASLVWMMILALFVIREKKEIRCLVRVLCIQTAIGAAFFLLFPVISNYPPRYGNEALPHIFLIADTLNLHNNQLPSLHVCFAFTSAFVLAHYARDWQAGLLVLWAFAVAVSAMTIHEHNLLDIAGGVLLAGWGTRYWRRLTHPANVARQGHSATRRPVVVETTNPD